MADIFISYSKRDKDVVVPFVEQLNAFGYSVWWDDRITPKQSWDRMIEQELDACRVVIPCWTPTARQSEWVRLEAGYGKENGKLVPVKLIDTPLPLAFNLIQWADLTDWRPGDANHGGFQRLLSWLDEFVPRPAAAQPAPPEPEPGPEPVPEPVPVPTPGPAPQIRATEFIQQDNSKFLESNAEQNRLPNIIGVLVVVAIALLALIWLAVSS